MLSIMPEIWHLWQFFERPISRLFASSESSPLPTHVVLVVELYTITFSISLFEISNRLPIGKATAN